MLRLLQIVSWTLNEDWNYYWKAVFLLGSRSCQTTCWCLTWSISTGPAFITPSTATHTCLWSEPSTLLSLQVCECGWMLVYFPFVLPNEMHHLHHIKYFGNPLSTFCFLALHKSFLIFCTGDYMVIFGGYLHKHKEEERCYDNKLYLYHLGCHVWMSHQLTPAKHAGMYGCLFTLLYSLCIFWKCKNAVLSPNPNSSKWCVYPQECTQRRRECMGTVRVSVGATHW